MFIFDLIGKSASGEICIMHCYARSEDEMDSVVINWIEHTDYVEREKRLLQFIPGE